MTFIPAGIIAVIFLFLIFDSLKQLQLLESLRFNSNKIKEVSRLITHLQQERGLSSGYLGSGGATFSKELADVRRKVDEDRQMSGVALELLDIRKKVDHLKISTIDSFDAYTKIIKNLQMRYFSIVDKISDPHLVKELYAYINLSFMKEAVGEIRGSFNGIFSAKTQPEKRLLYNALSAKGKYDTSFERFYATASKSLLKQFHALIASSEYKYIERIIEKYAFEEI